MHTQIYEGFLSHGAARLSSWRGPGPGGHSSGATGAGRDFPVIFWRGFWMMNGSMISPAKLH